MLDKSFPSCLQKEVDKVDGFICNKFDEQQTIKWSLSNGEEVKLPYRLNIAAVPYNALSVLSDTQKQILFCLGTRSNNGYVRQESLKLLFDGEICEWALPYVVKLSDEYVEDILEVIYEKFKNRYDKALIDFCYNNRENLIKGYERMISYWNEYYRDKHQTIATYVGYKLYQECFQIRKLIKGVKP